MQKIQTNFGILYYYRTERNTFHGVGFGIEESSVHELVFSCEERFISLEEMAFTTETPYWLGYAYACGYVD